MNNQGYMSIDSGSTIHLWLATRSRGVFDRLELAKRNKLERKIRISPVFHAEVMPHSVQTGFGSANYLIKVVDLQGRCWYSVAVNDRPCTTIPDLVLRLNYPAQRTRSRIDTDFREVITALFKTAIVKERVSRADIAFTVNDSAERFIKKVLNKDYISHLKMSNCRVFYSQNGKYGSLCLGSHKNQNVRLTIYDKCEEVLSGSNGDLKAEDLFTFFHNEEVVRIEFSLYRQCLRSWDVENVDTFNMLVDSIAHWLVHEFFRVVEHKTRNNSKRDKIDAKWLFVQSLASDKINYVRLPKTRDYNCLRAYNHLVSMGSGVFASILSNLAGDCSANFDKFYWLMKFAKKKIVEKAKFKRQARVSRFDLSFAGD